MIDYPHRVNLDLAVKLDPPDQQVPKADLAFPAFPDIQAHLATRDQQDQWASAGVTEPRALM